MRPSTQQSPSVSRDQSHTQAGEAMSFNPLADHTKRITVIGVHRVPARFRIIFYHRSERRERQALRPRAAPALSQRLDRRRPDRRAGVGVELAVLVVSTDAASSILVAALNGYDFCSSSDQSTSNLPLPIDVAAASNHPLPMNIFAPWHRPWSRGSGSARHPRRRPPSPASRAHPR